MHNKSFTSGGGNINFGGQYIDINSIGFKTGPSRIKLELTRIKESSSKDNASSQVSSNKLLQLSQTTSQEEAQKIVDEIIFEIHDNNNDRKYSTENIINALEKISSVHQGVFKDYVAEYLDGQKKIIQHEKVQYLKNYVQNVLEFVKSKNITLPDKLEDEKVDYKAAITYLSQFSHKNLQNDCFYVAFRQNSRDLFQKIVDVLNDIESDDEKLKYIIKFYDIFHPAFNDLLVPAIKSMSNEYRKPLIEATKPSIETNINPRDIRRFVRSLFIKGNDDEIKLGLEILRETIQTVEIYDLVYLNDMFQLIPREYDTDFLNLLSLYQDDNKLDQEISFLAAKRQKPLTESNIDQIITIIDTSIQAPHYKTMSLNNIIPLCNEEQINRIVEIGKDIPLNNSTRYFDEKIKKWNAAHSNGKMQDENVGTFQQMIEQSRNQIKNNNLNIG